MPIPGMLAYYVVLTSLQGLHEYAIKLRVDHTVQIGHLNDRSMNTFAG